MKKIIIYVLILLLAASLIGCGAKEKLEEKAGEELAEKIIEEAGGGDVELDGDTVTIKGEDGEEMTFGATEWPTSDLSKSIPEFKDGEISTVMEADDSLFVIVGEVSEKDVEAYLDEIKKLFATEASELRTESGVMYGARNDKNLVVSLTYEKGAGLTLTLTQEKP